MKPWLRVLPFVLVACGGAPSASTIAQRASIDLQCDAGDVLVRRMFGKTYETVGCGRRAVFVCNARECRRDTDVMAAEEGSGAENAGSPRPEGPAAAVHDALWTVHAELESCVSEPTTLVVEVTDGRFTSLEAEEPLSGDARSCLARALLGASVAGNLSAGPVRYPLRQP
ncbi:MAG: hypothetical protein H6722_01700 [Sandaracinus sp.]|nr:hypothetical protein [Sandaracinus sp.]